MPRNAMPSAAYRVSGKRGVNDCAVAALAFILRRDYEEVLIAAAKVAPTVWDAGLSSPDMIRIARRLGTTMRWVIHFDSADDIGVLWISYHDSTREHCVVLIEGWVYEVEQSPVSLWRYDEYMAATNAYGKSLLQVVE